MKKIEENDKATNRRIMFKELIEMKAKSVDYNFKNLDIVYPYSARYNGSDFTVEEDRFLLETLYLVGYG